MNYPKYTESNPSRPRNASTDMIAQPVIIDHETQGEIDQFEPGTVYDIVQQSIVVDEHGTAELIIGVTKVDTV